MFCCDACRTKYIARSSATIRTGLHLVLEAARGFSDAIVPPEVALSHHYRLCAASTTTACNAKKDPSIVVRRVWELAAKFVASAAHARQRYSETCGLRGNFSNGI